MKQIKTILHPFECGEFSPAYFDQRVNETLAEGWTLINRYTVPELGLVAELEREIITEAERGCDNCRYYDANPEAEPCASCSEDCDKWEGYNA